tara:strand:- start:224 stop:409 length:186 start_codon:yes stop_codon:yes gene_type:complete
MREARIDAHLSQLDAAALLGITPAYLSRLECGRQQPSLKLLQRCAQVYCRRLVVRFTEVLP